VLAQKLNWPKSVPLLLPERYGPHSDHRWSRSRPPGRARLSESNLPGAGRRRRGALRSAVEIDRRAVRLLAVAPKLRTKGAEPVIARLLNEDAVPASAPGSNLSRWAATGCSSGWKVLALCANCPAAPPSGFLGCDDDGIERSYTSKRRPTKISEANASTIASSRICRRSCAGGNGCCGWRR
jgi:hypothetical protein